MPGCSGLGAPTNSKLFPFRRAAFSLCRVVPALGPPTNNKLFPFRRGMFGFCRVGPALGPPTNCKLFPFRRAAFNLCRVVPTWGPPTNSKLFPFRRAVFSLCRVVLAWGHRRTASFFHSVGACLADPLFSAVASSSYFILIRTPPLREPQPDAARSPTDGEELRNRLQASEPSGHVL